LRGKLAASGLPRRPHLLCDGRDVRLIVIRRTRLPGPLRLPGHVLGVLVDLRINLAEHGGVTVAEQVRQADHVHAVVQRLGGVAFSEGSQAVLLAEFARQPELIPVPLSYGCPVRRLRLGELSRLDSRPIEATWLLPAQATFGDRPAAEGELEAAEEAVDGILRPRLAVGVPQEWPGGPLLAQRLQDGDSFIGQIDDPLPLLALRLLDGEGDAALLEIDVSGLDGPQLLRPGSRLPGRL
jgi:hypothetical protein